MVNAIVHRDYNIEGATNYLYIDPEKIKVDLKWEGSDEIGEDFPHLYASLPLEAVVRVEDFTKDKNGNYVMP